MKNIFFLYLFFFAIFPLRQSSEEERPSFFKQKTRSIVSLDQISKDLFQKLEMLDALAENEGQYTLEQNIQAKENALKDFDQFIKLLDECQMDDLFNVEVEQQLETLNRFQFFLKLVENLRSDLQALRPLKSQEETEKNQAKQESSTIITKETEFSSRGQEILRQIKESQPIIITSKDPFSVAPGKVGKCEGNWEAFKEWISSESIKLIVNFIPKVTYCDPCQETNLNFNTLYESCTNCKDTPKENVVFNRICVTSPNDQIHFGTNAQDEEFHSTTVQISISKVGECQGKWTFERLPLNKVQFKFLSDNLECDPLLGERVSFAGLYSVCGKYCKNFNKDSVLFILGNNHYTDKTLEYVVLGNCQGKFAKINNEKLEFQPNIKFCNPFQNDSPSFDLIYDFCGVSCKGLEKKSLEFVIERRSFKYVEGPLTGQNFQIGKLGTCDGFWTKRSNLNYQFIPNQCSADPCKDATTFNDFYQACGDFCEGKLQDIKFGPFCSFHNSQNVNSFTKFDFGSPFITMERFGRCKGKWTARDVTNGKRLFRFVQTDPNECNLSEEVQPDFHYLIHLCGSYCDAYDYGDIIFNWDNNYIINELVKWYGCDALWLPKYRANGVEFNYFPENLRCELVNFDNGVDVPSFEILWALTPQVHNVPIDQVTFNFGEIHFLKQYLKNRDQTENKNIVKVGMCEGFFSGEHKNGEYFIHFNKLDIFCDTCFETIEYYFEELIPLVKLNDMPSDYSKVVFSPLCFIHQFAYEIRYDPNFPIINDLRLGNCDGNWKVLKLKHGYVMIMFTRSDKNCILDFQGDFYTFRDVCGQRCDSINDNDLIINVEGNLIIKPFEQDGKYGRISKCNGNWVEEQEGSQRIKQFIQTDSCDLKIDGLYYDFLQKTSPKTNENIDFIVAGFRFRSPGRWRISPNSNAIKTSFRGCSGSWALKIDKVWSTRYVYFIRDNPWCDICSPNQPITFKEMYTSCFPCWDFEYSEVNFATESLCHGTFKNYDLKLKFNPKDVPEVNKHSPKFGGCRGKMSIIDAFAKIKKYNFEKFETNVEGCDPCSENPTFNGLYDKIDIFKNQDLGSVELTIQCLNGQRLLKFDANDPPQFIKDARQKVSITTGAVFQAFLDSSPPEFCWKKGGDFGFIPKNCPPNYFRSLAMCYENCKPGYKMTAGVCWETCRPECTNWGLFCSCRRKDGGDYWRSSYITSQLTNFDRRVTCGGEPGQYYKGLALCYRDCEFNPGHVNCGIGACSNGSAGCVSIVMGMVVDAILTIAKAIFAVITFGGSTIASEGLGKLKGAIVKMGKAGFKGAFKAAKSSFDRILKTSFTKLLSKIKKKTMQFIFEKFNDHMVDTYIDEIVDDVVKKMYTAIEGKENPNDMQQTNERDLAMLDFTNIANTVDACMNIHKHGSLKCAKESMGVVSLFDPTGLISLASSFMHPHCEDI